MNLIFLFLLCNVVYYQIYDLKGLLGLFGFYWTYFIFVKLPSHICPSIVFKIFVFFVENYRKMENSYQKILKNANII